MPALWKPAQLSGVTAFSHASRKNWKWWSLDKNHGLPVVSVVFESPTKLWSSSSWCVSCEEANKSLLYLANQTVVGSKCFLWPSVRSGNGQPEIGLLRKCLQTQKWKNSWSIQPLLLTAYLLSLTSLRIHKLFNHLRSNKDHDITSTSNYSNFGFVPRGVVSQLRLAFSSYHLWSMRIKWHTHLIYIVNPFLMAFKIKLITYFSKKTIAPFNVLSINDIHTHTCCGISLSWLQSWVFPESSPPAIADFFSTKFSFWQHSLLHF